MKTKKYNIITRIAKVAFVILLIGIGFFSCKEEKNDPMPSVTNFRVVEKDSSISSGAFGLYVAIQGQNLQNVQEVWFNDLKATLNPNFITANNIICAIPNKLPGEILNTVKLVTGGGQVYTTDFKVELPKPVIKGMYNEMAAPGTTTKILGDYLFFIKSVKIGNVSAEVLDVKEHAITIKIPADAEAGSLVTVEAEGGTVVSTFKYKDAGMWLFDFDKNATSWGSVACWGGMKMREDSESQGKYGYVEGKDLPPSGWNNDWVTSTCWFDYGYNNVNLDDKLLKFEVYAKEPWKWNDALSAGDHAALLININGDKHTYEFRPQQWAEYKTTGFTTDGWMTVTIPMSVYKFGTVSINDFQLVFKTNKQVYDKFETYFDNFRIVTPEGK